MPNFGIIEALERVTTPLTLELRELLQGITEEQRRTNNLLGQLVAGQRGLLLETAQEGAKTREAVLRTAEAAAGIKTPAKKPSVR